MGLKVEQANAVDKIVGANLRQLRTAHKMSQMALANAVGISFQQIQKYERGANRIGASRLWQFCGIFSARPNDFFVGALNESDEIVENDIIQSQRIDFFKHPRGSAMATAFLAIKNAKMEKGVIDLCRSLVAE